MCRLDSFEITGLYVEAHRILDRSLCLLQVYEYAPNATSEYRAFVDELNDALLRVGLSPIEFKSLWGI